MHCMEAMIIKHSNSGSEEMGAFSWSQKKKKAGAFLAGAITLSEETSTNITVIYIAVREGGYFFSY